MNIDKVKDLCKAHSMTIYDLEEACGFGKSSIYNWQRNNPSIDRVKKVASYFNVSVDYLISEEIEETMTEKEELLQHLFDDQPERRMLFSVTEDATPEEIMQFVKVIEALKKD